MRRLACWCLCLAWLGVAALQAEEPKLEQPGAPPQLGLLTEVNAETGDIAIWYVEAKMVVETEMIEEVVDGQRVVRTELVPRQVHEHRIRKHNLRGVQIVTGAGEVLDPVAALPRLKRGRMLFFYTGDKLDERYQQVMKEDALIVLIPVKAGP